MDAANPYFVTGVGTRGERRTTGSTMGVVKSEASNGSSVLEMAMGGGEGN